MSIQRLKQTVRWSRNVGRDDQWHVAVGSAGLLNLSVVLGIPVHSTSRGGSDGRFGVPILGPVQRPGAADLDKRLGLREQLTDWQVVARFRTLVDCGEGAVGGCRSGPSWCAAGAVSVQ